MIHTDILIIGAGPAGLSAANVLAETGASILVLERSHVYGGQLVKQTHMFFGSEKQYASYRGFDISEILVEKIKAAPNVKVMLNATALSVFESGVVAADIDGKYVKIMPKTIIAATGASEKFLPFPGNDLPGIYGAGAVQTLMNQFGVLPAKRVVMLGAGNIGLIVSYQLLQAGVDVACVVEGGPRIGGYLVHASKLRRMGVPILTSHSVKAAHGTNSLEGVTIWQLDDKWQGIPGTEQTIEADAFCVAVGLTPLSELLWQAGCDMRFIGALGGHVAMRDENLRTSKSNIYIAGDVAGIEEASAAMVEGTLAGLSAASDMGFKLNDHQARIDDCKGQLESLRRGHGGDRIKSGIAEARI